MYFILFQAVDPEELHRRNYQLTSTKASGIDQDQVKLKTLKEIPGPKEYPIIGRLLEYGKHDRKQHLWFKELQKKHGDVVRLNILGNDIIFLFNPEYTRKMYASDSPTPYIDAFDHWCWYRNVRRKERYPDGNAGVAGSYLDIWKEQRSAVNPDIMRKSSALYYVPQLDEITSDCVDRIAETRDDKNEIRKAIPTYMYSYGFEATCKLFLDVRMGALEPGELDPTCAKFIAMSKQMNDISRLLARSKLWKYFDTPTYKKFDEACTFIYDESSVHIKAAIKRLKDNKEDEDKPRDQWSVLHKMVDKFGEDSTIPVVMSTDAVLGGVDTTGFTSSFLLYHLANNPLKQEKAIEEVDRLFEGGKLTQEKFSQLRYIKACLMESQRMCPAASSSVRRIQSDITVGGYLIPKGSQVVNSIYVNGQNPKNFPEPDKFLPERWLRGHPDESKAHKFAHIPFGFGPRSCLGKRFAEVEAQAVAVKMLQRFRMEFHDDPVSFSFHFANSVDRDMRIRLIERS